MPATLPPQVVEKQVEKTIVTEESVSIPEPEVKACLKSAISVETLTQSLLEIVSEKTGYPTEMLEMNMDMEADLGIDSIKRVEILGAMQSALPGITQGGYSHIVRNAHPGTNCGPDGVYPRQQRGSIHSRARTGCNTNSRRSNPG